jgi:hypothetical protein
MNTGETGGESAVGIGYEDAVHNAGIIGTDYVPLPFAGAVITERGLIAVVGSGSAGAGERGVYENRTAVAEKISNAQTVAGREAVNFYASPGLKRVGNRGGER